MAAEPISNDDAELVEIFDAQQESEVQVVQGLLDSAGIESVLTARDAPQDVLPGVGGMVLRVSADKADEAVKLIEEYRSNPAAEADGDETTA